VLFLSVIMMLDVALTERRRGFLHICRGGLLFLSLCGMGASFLPWAFARLSHAFASPIRHRHVTNTVGAVPGALQPLLLFSRPRASFCGSPWSGAIVLTVAPNPTCKRHTRRAGRSPKRPRSDIVKSKRAGGS